MMTVPLDAKKPEAFATTKKILSNVILPDNLGNGFTSI